MVCPSESLTRNRKGADCARVGLLAVKVKGSCVKLKVSW